MLWKIKFECKSAVLLEPGRELDNTWASTDIWTVIMPTPGQAKEAHVQIQPGHMKLEINLIQLNAPPGYSGAGCLLDYRVLEANGDLNGFIWCIYPRVNYWHCGLVISICRKWYQYLFWMKICINNKYWMLYFQP